MPERAQEFEGGSEGSGSAVYLASCEKGAIVEALDRLFEKFRLGNGDFEVASPLFVRQRNFLTLESALTFFSRLESITREEKIERVIRWLQRHVVIEECRRNKADCDFVEIMKLESSVKECEEMN